MTTEQLTGEITRKSIRNRFYTLTVSDRQLSFKVSFDHLPANQYFINGDIIDFEADLTSDAPIIVKTLRKRTNKYFEELKSALISRQIIKAFVYEKNAGGFNVSYKGYKCFLPFYERVYKGSTFGLAVEILRTDVDFHVKSIVEKQVILTRVSIEKEAQFQNRLKEIKTLNPGQSYFATIKLIIDFGLLLERHHSSGLLHMNDILGIDTKALKKLKPALYKLVKATFEIDDRLYLSVKEIREEKYSLTWDKTNIINSPFWENLVSLIAKDIDYIKIKEHFETNEKNFRYWYLAQSGSDVFR